MEKGIIVFIVLMVLGSIYNGWETKKLFKENRTAALAKYGWLIGKLYDKGFPLWLAYIVLGIVGFSVFLIVVAILK